MRVSELAEASGVSVATIKYYLREGLLPPGRKLTPRLSDYDDTHVRRLRLLQLLRDVGDVPIERLRAAAAVADTSLPTPHHALAVVADALAPEPPPPTPDRPAMRALADGLIERAGWTGIRAEAKDRDNLAAALEVLAGLGLSPAAGDPTPYLQAADLVGRHEIAALDDTRGRGAMVEQMVVGQVVFAEVLVVLRRLAEEHYSRERFGDPAAEPTDP